MQASIRYGFLASVTLYGVATAATCTSNLLIDDFSRRSTSNNNLGGYTNDDGSMRSITVQGTSLILTPVPPADGRLSPSYYYENLPCTQALSEGYSAISFTMKAPSKGSNFTLEIQTSTSCGTSAYTSDWQVVKDLTGDLQTVTIPLSGWRNPVTNLDAVKAFNWATWTSPTQGHGDEQWQLGDIMFLREQLNYFSCIGNGRNGNVYQLELTCVIGVIHHVSELQQLFVDVFGLCDEHNYPHIIHHKHLRVLDCKQHKVVFYDDLPFVDFYLLIHLVHLVHLIHLIHLVHIQDIDNDLILHVVHNEHHLQVVHHNIVHPVLQHQHLQINQHHHLQVVHHNIVHPVLQHQHLQINQHHHLQDLICIGTNNSQIDHDQSPHPNATHAHAAAAAHSACAQPAQAHSDQEANLHFPELVLLMVDRVEQYSVVQVEMSNNISFWPNGCLCLVAARRSLEFVIRIMSLFASVWQAYGPTPRSLI
ncbi:hypothetical protein MCOR32_008928 [Pyricularia oryzae]|nr:hypothetical protein MCOR32_008928 [Pyricularia oryzae]